MAARGKGAAGRWTGRTIRHPRRAKRSRQLRSAHSTMHEPIDAEQGGRPMYTRRDALASISAAAAVAAAAPEAFAAWEPSQRYPDPSVQVLDPSFNKYRLLLAGVERLATGARWSEGPVYFGDARCVYWSDIPRRVAPPHLPRHVSYSGLSAPSRSIRRPRC